MQWDKRLVNVAWITGTLTFILMEIVGVYLTDAIRTSYGERPPLAFLIFMAIFVSWAGRKYLLQKIK